MKISVKLIKKLREKTGLGILNCRKYLLKSGGDINKAISYIREFKNVKEFSKNKNVKGKIFICENLNTSIIFEIHVDTDFTFNIDIFKNFIKTVCNSCIEMKNVSLNDLLNFSLKNGHTIEQELGYISKILKENIKIVRINSFSICDKEKTYVLGSYCHNNNLIGSIVLIKGKNKSLAHDIAMHIVASNPVCVSRNIFDKNVIEKHTGIYFNNGHSKNDCNNSDNNYKKIENFIKNNNLLDQLFIKNNNQKIKDLISSNDSYIKGFISYSVGENIL